MFFTLKISLFEFINHDMLASASSHVTVIITTYLPDEPYL